jgi:hypothetical protein
MMDCYICDNGYYKCTCENSIPPVEDKRDDIDDKHGFQYAFDWNAVDGPGRFYCTTKEQFIERFGHPDGGPGCWVTCDGINTISPRDTTSSRILWTWFGWTD